jgi:hypothetical protein
VKNDSPLESQQSFYVVVDALILIHSYHRISFSKKIKYLICLTIDKRFPSTQISLTENERPKALYKIYACHEFNLKCVNWNNSLVIMNLTESTNRHLWTLL